MRIGRAGLLVIPALAACAAPAAAPPPPAELPAHLAADLAAATDGILITDALLQLARAWDRRDLDAFMEVYADDAILVGSRGVLRGKAEIRQSYATRWFAPGRDPGRLSLGVSDVRTLGGEYALAIGHFVVATQGGEPVSGMFTVTMRRTADGWLIVHDHSPLHRPPSGI